MSTFLFDQIIFGPVKSRRLGHSLGVNLLPNNSKLCNYNCIYCECGWTPDAKSDKPKLHARHQVSSALKTKLADFKIKNSPIDSITFAGNGEPTIHPDFPGIIDDTIEIRNSYFPEARIAVLSNSSRIHKPEIFEALMKVDDNILKLDSAIPNTNQLMNQPKGEFDIDRIVEHMIKFESKFILQTMFLKGNYQGQGFDNTSDTEIQAWIELIKKVKPRMVMIYTIARDTAHNDLEKIPLEKLNEIARLIEEEGFKVQVSG